MYNRLREIAYSAGANNCKHCGKIDIAFGTFKKDGDKLSTCVYCSKTVEQFGFESTLLYALRVFRLLAIEKNEVKATASPILKNKIDEILIPLESQNIIPSLDKLQDFQKFIKNPVEINFGGPLIGGFVKIQSGKPSVSIIETNNNTDNVYALFVSVAVVKYLLTLTDIQSKSPAQKTEATPQMLAIMIGIMASDLYLKPENRKPANVFEVLLFSSIEILATMKKKLPGFYSEFEIEYFNEIEKFADKHGIKRNIGGDFNEFVDSRFQLYGTELNILLQHPDVLPTKIAYHFFDAPLSIVTSDSVDILKISELKFKIEEAFNSNLVVKSIDKIISDLKLTDKKPQINKEKQSYSIPENPLAKLVESQFKYLAIDGKRIDFKQYFQAFYKMVLKERADHKFAVSQVMEIPTLILQAMENSSEVNNYLRPYKNEIVNIEQLFCDFDRASKYLIDNDPLENYRQDYRSTSRKNENTISDIEGNVYKTAKIGSQLWMAENLQVTKFQNGDDILFANSNQEWEYASLKRIPAWCWSEAHIEGRIRNDKLYNWYAVIDKRNIAPKGWRIPSIKDWNELQKLPEMAKHFGGAKILKSIDGWSKKNLFVSGNGDNKSGFNGLPNGLRNEYGKYTFLSESKLGKSGYWWSSTMCIFYPPDERMGFCCGKNPYVDIITEEHEKYLKGESQFCRFNFNTAYSFYLDFDSGFLTSGPQSKGCGFSIRCIGKDY